MMRGVFYRISVVEQKQCKHTLAYIKVKGHAHRGEAYTANFSLCHDCGRRGRWGLSRHKGTKKMPPNLNERPKAGGKLEKEGRNGSILKNRCINFVSVRLQAMSNVPKSSRKHGIFGWLKGFFFFVDGAAVEPLRKPTLRFLEVLLRKSGLVDKVLTRRA